MKGIKIVNRKKETCSTFKLKLEPGTYSITELGKIINSNGKQAIDRKLRSWEVSYSSTGRGAAREYTIEELRNPFKIFCITELGIDVHTDFNKIRDVYYFLLNDPEVPFWPAEKLSALLDSMDRSVSRQSIRKYIEKLIVNNYAGIDYQNFKYYFAYKDNYIETTRERYSQAWRKYWILKKEEGMDSGYAIWDMICCYGGVARKHEGIAFNGIYISQIDYLNSLVCKSLEDETVSLFELYNTNLMRYKEQDAESIFKSDF